MGPAAQFLALPFFGGAILALWWMTRRLPAGERGVRNGLTAVFLIPPLAVGGWLASLHALTQATYVCLECGRTEMQYRLTGLTLSRTLLVEEEEYQQRFPAVADAGHAHDWQLESGSADQPGGKRCRLSSVAGWFRILPRLREREVADQLFRESLSLPLEGRRAMMEAVHATVWLQHEVNHADPDKAVRSWLRLHRAASLVK